jgi:quinol monooxygenase YgiN
VSVLVLLEFNAKPGNADDIMNYMKAELHHTREYEGCNGITVQRNEDDSNNMVIVENWESLAHHEKYLAWRTERGDMEKMGAWVAGDASIRYFQNARV